jgi:sulfopyruvate decarboxylase TPP-binding subunit
MNPNANAIKALYNGLKAGGADFFVHLPDSVLYPVISLLEKDPSVQVFTCAREDEGVAMAAGAYLAGKLPVVVMEGSGIGYSGLILARLLVARTPVLILASHSRVLGEPYDYHLAGSLSGEGVLKGLNIPFQVVDDVNRVSQVVKEALVTVRGQKTVVGLLFAPYVLEDEPR